MHPILSTILLFASLTPAKMWFPPDQPIMVDVKPGGAEATLVLTDFAGKILAPTGNADVAEDKPLNVKEAFQQLNNPGTYVLYLTKRGTTKDLSYAPTDFIGTPLVVNVRQDMRAGGGMPIVTRVEPLRYAVMSTPHGPMTMIFYYEVAPNTVRHFQTLAEEGFYDGLTFHRILPGFVIQGGDPLGNSRGGPGFTVPAEFSRRKHTEGVLSMARSDDPNSAGSQFFICLDYAQTKQLDEKYTAFGELAAGMDAARKIAAVPLVDPRAGQPKEKQVIDKVEVKPVTAAENPYLKLFQPVKADAAPAAGGQ